VAAVAVPESGGTTLAVGRATEAEKHEITDSKYVSRNVMVIYSPVRLIRLAFPPAAVVLMLATFSTTTRVRS
jgi:hypothetical protein